MQRLWETESAASPIGAVWARGPNIERLPQETRERVEQTREQLSPTVAEFRQQIQQQRAAAQTTADQTRTDARERVDRAEEWGEDRRAEFVDALRERREHAPGLATALAQRRRQPQPDELGTMMERLRGRERPEAPTAPARPAAPAVGLPLPEMQFGIPGLDALGLGLPQQEEEPTT